MTEPGVRWDRHRLPPARLRVGVTGHRDGPKLPEESLAAVRAGVERILSAAVEAAGRGVEAVGLDSRRDEAALAGTARGAVVCQLAEGADRIVAEAGLAAGFTLEAIVPFHPTEFAKDFATHESQEKFSRLLARA